MYAPKSNAARNCRTDQTHRDPRRNSCAGQKHNLNNQRPQFDRQEVFTSPEILNLAQQILQGQQDGFVYGYTPTGQMRWGSSQQLNTAQGLQDSSRRYSCSAQTLVSNIPSNQIENNQPPQFNRQEVFRSPDILHLTQQILQGQRDEFSYGYTPNGQMRWGSSQQLNTAQGLQDSSRRYSCSAQNLVSNILANRGGSQTNLNNTNQYRGPQNTTMAQQSARVRNGPSAELVQGKFLSAQHLDLVGRRKTIAPSPMKRARLHLKFSNLPPGFAVKDVVQKILGTDKMLVIWHGRPDIRLLRDKNGGLPYCIAQFINEMEAEKIRVFWNGTEIVKGKGRLVVEYFNDY